jgi:regulator of protease activity HflC (stomatin/prohibitin superfamily)
MRDTGVVTMLFLFVCLLLVVVAFVVGGLQVLLAKSTAIRKRKNQVNLFWGLVKLVLWEANEGLVFLKNKRISDVVFGPKEGGGTKYIYPIFGEELRVRVPLTLKLTRFQDQNVLTRESTRLFMKVAIWWRVQDLERYYYLIDKQVHVMTDEPARGGILDVLPADDRQAQQDAAETWILTLAESCIRKLVSQSTTALVVSKNALSYMHIEDQVRPAVYGSGGSQEKSGTRLRPARATTSQERAVPETLADEIHAMLEPKAEEYGLEIDRVEVQEVRLPQELQEALDRLFRSHLLPAQSEQESKARQIELQAVANVLGVESVALSEVMKQFRGSTYIGGFPKFVEALFAKSFANAPAGDNLLSGQADSRAAPALPDRGPVELPEARSEVKCRCPKCGKIIRVDVDKASEAQVFECPYCGTGFRVGPRKTSQR